MQPRVAAGILILALALGALALPVAADPVGPAAAWTDDFDNPTLDPSWFWINEDPTHWSLTARPGFMRIIAQEGGNNILLQAAPAGDTTIETRLLFEPAHNIQRAGLFLLQDFDNSLTLMRAYCNYGSPGCPGNAIFFDHIEAGQPVGSNYAMTTSATGEAYLRIIARGRAYSGYVSEDGVHWTLVGTHVVAADFAPAAVGLMANYTALSPDTGEIPADFDYFAWRELSQRLYLPLIMR